MWSGMSAKVRVSFRKLRQSDGGILLNKLTTSKENRMEESAMGRSLSVWHKVMEFLILNFGWKLILFGKNLLKKFANI